ncbi:MAG: GreA/GreB family elongation factor [Candidatus Sumerlaeia bacterium]|nr:GreA/GreB family elongation factor [Candidatus Sumerlaeia bacterium]
MKILSLLDKERLHEVSDSAFLNDTPGRGSVKGLNRLLNEAEFKDPADVPDDVVTMNSKVRLRLKGENEDREFTLAFPDESNYEEDRFSILTPIAQAVLGSKVGDTVEWEAPRGKCRATIKAIIYQPEAERAKR